MTSRTSFTPAVTADICSKARRVVPATASASVVLPGARRTPEDRAGQPVLLDQPAQRPTGTDEVLLADDLVERARPQPGGERRLAAQLLLGGGAEQIAHRSRSQRATSTVPVRRRGATR